MLHVWVWTVRRNPDLLWKYNEDNLASITKDQFEILSHASLS